MILGTEPGVFYVISYAYPHLANYVGALGRVKNLIGGGGGALLICSPKPLSRTPLLSLPSLYKSTLISPPFANSLENPGPCIVLDKEPRPDRGLKLGRCGFELRSIIKTRASLLWPNLPFQGLR
jgi:hypothetical protein